MKKKILIGLSIISLSFLIGGIFLIINIQRVTSELNNLITLHQVEILREHLLLHIERAQSGLTLKNTAYVRNMDVLVRDVQHMSKVVGACLNCHHSEQIKSDIINLNDRIEDYKGALSRAFTLRANVRRLEAEENNAFKKGEELISRVSKMIVLTSSKLEQRTHFTIRKIKETRAMLFTLILTGPLLTIVLAYILIKGLNQINLLVDAASKIKKGDLEYKITGVSDEFVVVADAFNEMADALKKHMNNINESEKRYRTLFESAGDAIFIMEAEGENPGRIISANQAAAEMHGYTVDQLLNMSIRDLDTPDEAGKIPEMVRRMLGGERIKAELKHRRKDGTVFPVEISAGLFEVGAQKYILALDRDITERKKTEEALQRTEQMKMVGELATGLAHEIKNPLAGIKASMEVLTNESTFSEEDKGVLLKVIAEIKRIEVLLKELLNFARPSKAQFTDVDVNSVIDAVFALLTQNKQLALNNSKTINVIKDLDGYLPEITADTMQLKQIFLNLILNAIDAMPEGGTLGVKTFFDPETYSIQIEVSDTGKGIDSKMMDKVFQPFFTTKPKGTGLGLAITRRLVDEHKGRISVMSGPAGGTAIRVGLPLGHDKVKTV